jgi:hypothetical protein
MRGLEGFSWIGDERVAIGSIPVGDTVRRLPELGVTHLVNCRAQLQTQISQDLWAERHVLGDDRVAHAPMWDNGHEHSPERWADAVRFAVAALESDPNARVLVQTSPDGDATIVVGGHENVELPHEMAHAVKVEKV